ncbi:hypothetical protein PtA15_13A203 [Puccinia triticina]|uniref:RRM domain-containing protein n=2 Tax=Puccinia triticina TaxID=208348 RepID=A0ABY7D1S4_9BASI|nr:uncharacterized protein PtA15_13A203 [Puccinia triticina]WAQ90804.1 hypothetical protein PtA15_13A203 [Puccinia triticina]WAR60989.1 hypothetical protein PtB15_13B240 [Puccinia triticina]
MASAGRRLYIGRIPPDATRTDVEKYFGRYGTLMDVRIMAGFGFLEYDSVRDAEDAVHDLNGRDFMGERLIVEFAKAPRGRDMHSGGHSGGPRRGGFRLLVKGLSHETSWQDLKDFARQAGNVTRADVDRNLPGEGLIEFGSQDDADNAIRKLDGTELKGMVVTLIEDRPGGGGRRDRSRSPGGYRDSRDRDRSPRDRSRDRERERSPRDRRYDRERRRSPPPRDDRDRERDRGYDRKERERSPRRDVRADSVSKKSPSD